METNTNNSRSANKNQKQGKKTKKKGRFGSIMWKAWCVFFIFLLVGTVAAGAFSTIIYLDAKKDLPAIDLTKIATPVSSVVYDRNDAYTADLAEDALITVTYDELPQSLIDAFTAVEDARFFNHKGIDGPRTVTAILDSYILNNGVNGGSTLTQQLVKNTLLTDKIAEDEDYKTSNRRKIDEWILSYELEKETSKKEIFTSYVNNAISYGRYSGVGTAAKRYFNKSVSELTLPEAALLAGIPQLPTENNPFYDINTATERYNTVINSMERHKFVTKEEADIMRAIPLADLVVRNQDEILNPNTAYFSAVEQELREIFKDTALDEAGLPGYYKNYKIYTHLDQEQQNFANEIMDTENYVDWEDAVYNTYGSEHTQEENLNFQGAFTVVDVKTGGIPAIGASRNIKQTNGVNIAVDGFKSPGSSIKPIIDYTPAVEKFDWAATHIMNDKPTYYSGTSSQVNNYNYGGHKGFITMQTAIADSTNTTAVQAMQLVGIEEAATIAGNMGLSKAKPLLEEGLLGEASALGGGLETTTKEMAGAYATLGNGGRYNKAHTIRRIENMKGEIIYQYIPEQTQVVKESTAATMTQALKYSRSNGTPASGRKQVNYDISFGAKTGTSSYSSEEISAYGVSTYAEKDHWMVGYSPEYAIAAWTGLAVEDGPTLKRTGGNTNSNKAVGSYMVAAWMNKFAPAGTDFGFLGSANSGKVGGIGGFEVSNNHNSSTVSWTVPGVDYPSGMTDADKASFGSVVFDVQLETTGGAIALANGVTSTSVGYSEYAYYEGITGVTVTARINNEKAQLVIPPVSATAAAQSKKNAIEVTKPIETTKPNETTKPVETTRPVVAF